MAARSVVAVYARISQDRSGDELGVRRQLADCCAEAQRRGWSVADEYMDDGVSAYSGKRGPAHERMPTDIAEGRRDAVIVWHTDRLHRPPIELEKFADTRARAGVRDVVTLSGDLDLANGEGLLMARSLAAVAANESHSESRRIAREFQERAAAGLPMGRGVRPFGFSIDRITHHPAEAPLVRALAMRALAGETLAALVRWLGEEGVPTYGGGRWRTVTVRHVLTNPRMWGMRGFTGARSSALGRRSRSSPQNRVSVGGGGCCETRRGARTARRSGTC